MAGYWNVENAGLIIERERRIKVTRKRNVLKGNKYDTRIYEKISMFRNCQSKQGVANYKSKVVKIHLERHPF